jgi:DNA-binding MarR family transcriptional regulator
MDITGLLVADVYECAGLLRRQGEAVAAKVGQTQARWQVLSVISDRGCTVPQAARRLGVTRQSVQRIANELVKDGLAQFASNPDHRTSPLLLLTAAGKSVLDSLNESAKKYHHELLLEMGEQEIVELRKKIQELNTKLRNRVSNGDV